MAKNQSWLKGRTSCGKRWEKKRRIFYFIQKVRRKYEVKVVTKKYVGITFMAISIAANRFRLIKQSTAIDERYTLTQETQSICNRQTIE